MRGYTIAVSTGLEEVGSEGKARSTICDTCDMPMLHRNGKNLESCVICPVLKKKVLKRILNPVNTQNSYSEQVYDNSPHDVAVSDARRELLDVSKRMSYYDRPQQLQQVNDKAESELYVEGTIAVHYARAVLVDQVTEVELEGNESSMTPRILFPDDGSVEVQVVQNENSCPPEAQCVVPPPPPPSQQTPSPKGRPPLAPQSKANQNSVKSVSFQQSVVQCTNAHPVAVSALVAIQSQIEDTKNKLLNAQDPKRQMLYSDLLTKLNGALVAVQKLEEITKQ
jgi:hypothetical protein